MKFHIGNIIESLNHSYDIGLTANYDKNIVWVYINNTLLFYGSPKRVYSNLLAFRFGIHEGFKIYKTRKGWWNE